jgi:hypothetical protein
VPYDTEFFTPGGTFAPPRVSANGEPNWLAKGPADVQKGPVTRTPQGPTVDAPLPAWTKVVVGLTSAGLLYSMDHWARPTLKASRMEQKHGLWGWLQSVLDNIQGFLDHGTNYVGHSVSKAAAHSAHGPAYTIGLQADRWNQIVWNLTYTQLAAEYTTGRLVHHVIPRQITRQVAPVKTQTRRLRKGIITLTKDQNATRHYVHTQLNHNVKPRLGRVETAVRHTIPNRIRRGEQIQAKTQAKQRADHRIILKLLPLLTVVGAVGLVLKAFTRLGTRYVLCENMKQFGNELCASPPGSGRRFGRLLRGLLSGFGGLLAPLFICQLFQAAVVVVGPLMSKMVEVAGFVGNALCDGEHSAAPPLVLHVTADPPVPNPIAL